jgi:hypothetical protein
MGELRRIGPPTRPGPFPRDIAHHLRELHDHADELLTLADLVTPPLAQWLGEDRADEFSHRLAGVVLELGELLELFADRSSVA